MKLTRSGLGEHQKWWVGRISKGVDLENLKKGGLRKRGGFGEFQKGWFGRISQTWVREKDRLGESQKECVWRISIRVVLGESQKSGWGKDGLGESQRGVLGESQKGMFWENLKKECELGIFKIGGGHVV